MVKRRKGKDTPAENDPRTEIDAALAQAARMTQEGKLDKAERWAKIANTMGAAAGRAAALPPPPSPPADDGTALLGDLRQRFNNIRRAHMEPENRRLWANYEWEQAVWAQIEQSRAAKENRPVRRYEAWAGRPELFPTLRAKI